MEVLPVGHGADIGFAQQKLLQCLDLFLRCHDVRVRLHMQSLVQDSDGGAGSNILLPHLNALIGGHITCICFPLHFFLDLLEFFLARHLCEKTSKLCAAVDGLCICLLFHNPLQILKCEHLDGAAVKSHELGHARHIPAVGLVLQVGGQNLKLRQGWRVLGFSLVLQHAAQELHFQRSGHITGVRLACKLLLQATELSVDLRPVLQQQLEVGKGRNLTCRCLAGDNFLQSLQVAQRRHLCSVGFQLQDLEHGLHLLVCRNS
mmetsp:Transcript_119383/g.283417  ORF Transcript_119383/g.283417 Transcript_119383/m.283417 type:complete len:261 (-) Transcript_119383:654-1436(-)